jgi:glycosyltransferase involved in cell wall biosynthesis
MTSPARQATTGRPDFAVAIPTRNRPAKLEWCLEALAVAQAEGAFRVYVLDSSTSNEGRDTVERVCSAFHFCELIFHDGDNLSKARNACARAVREALVVNVDDDIQVEPSAVRLLVEAYVAHAGPRMVSGTVAWGSSWSSPRRINPLGWGDTPRRGDAPDFFVGAFFLYPRALALALPWHERSLPGPRRGVADDRYIGALWRSRSVAILFEPRARAHHHPEHNAYGLADEATHVYTNLVQGWAASRSVRRTVSFEVLGFLRGLREYRHDRASLRVYLSSWITAHRAFYEDRRYLREVFTRDLPSELP